MKKTLIAMAAAATLATAFAQATISGYMSAGYQTSTTGGATAASAGGFGVDTAELYITAMEDIGGGLKAGGSYGIGGLERAGGNSTTAPSTGYSVYGTNFTLFVQNEMGKVSIGNAKSGDYVSGGLASSGVNYYDYGDYGNFGARSRRDYIAFEAPVGPITVAVAHQEAANVVGGFAGAEGSGTQRLSVIQASYAAGAIKLNTQYFNIDNQVANSNTSGANTFRLSGNYNLGVATIGAGMQRSTFTSAATATNLGASVSVPLGSLTLGAMIGSRITDNYVAAASNGTLASYSVSASYALSKRTGVTGQFSNWDPALNMAVKSSMGLLLLTHSF
jgi:hypothetical protein